MSKLGTGINSIPLKTYPWHLSVEASELVEIFQWLKESDIKKVEKEKVADEIADIFFYLLRISQKMNIDIEQSFHNKMIKNIKNILLSYLKENQISVTRELRFV